MDAQARVMVMSTPSGGGSPELVWTGSGWSTDGLLGKQFCDPREADKAARALATEPGYEEPFVVSSGEVLGVMAEYAIGEVV